eukprot:scaffold21907_cov57-Phaeocystis_antarctica.AAC.4
MAVITVRVYIVVLRYHLGLALSRRLHPPKLSFRVSQRAVAFPASLPSSTGGGPHVSYVAT